MLRLKAEQLDRLRIYADLHDMTVSDAIRQFIDEGLAGTRTRAKKTSR